MSIALSYPGVYIQEVPSGVRAISGVATAIAAFVGAAPRGPLDEPVAISSFGDYERRFGGLAPASTMGYAVRDFFRNGGGQAVIVRVANGATPAAIPITGMPLLAASPGAWGNRLRATVEHPADAERFNLVITEEGGAAERHLNLSVNPADARFVPRVLEQGSALARVRRNAQGAFEVPAARPALGQTAATAASGGDGAALTAGQFAGPGMEGAKTGIFALEKTGLFNLLCLPPLSRDGDLPAAVYQAALPYCVRRRAMLLVDPPAAWSAAPTQAVAAAGATLAGLALSGPAARNAALYFPRIIGSDPLRDGQVAPFVPCGAVAGVMARTDSQRGVWKAPAGTDAALNGAQGLEAVLNDAENGALNPLGINCLRSFPVTGQVVWGARTLRGADQLADEYKYIPVRRLALFIEESLYRGTQWVVFEPNDEPLWSQIRLNIGAFMQNLFRQGAFQGRTPREAYFVKCDKETTTQSDIDLGIVNIHVGFAPLKPAEFVVIRIQQIAGQVAA